jgi:putative phosphoesterase
MRIAVLSDIHDQVWKLSAALEAVRGTDAMICCGDLCSPFIVHQMARGFGGPIHIVFGNNDGDLFRITANAQKYRHVSIHGEFLRTEFDGRRVAAQHYDNLGRAIAASGEFDLVLFGHNHVYEMGRRGRTLVINPGSVMGATFAPEGTRTDVDATFAIWDSATDQATGYRIVAREGGGWSAELMAE